MTEKPTKLIHVEKTQVGEDKFRKKLAKFPQNSAKHDPQKAKMPLPTDRFIFKKCCYCFCFSDPKPCRFVLEKKAKIENK